MKIKYIYSGLALILSLSLNAQTTYNVLDYGAKGDGKTFNTKSIQKAIDECHADGGGIVIIPRGTFLSSTLILKSNVTLHLEPTAVLLGAPEIDQYEPYMALIYAKDQENISISGAGKIDGNGIDGNFFKGNRNNGAPHKRPRTIQFEDCRFVKLKEFMLQNGAKHCIVLVKCVNVSVNNISVISRVIANNDGIDIVDCYHVNVSDCYFDCGDDAICLKSNYNVGVKNVVITNCIIKSESNGIKFGTGSVGGFCDVAISNCVIRETRLSGIALEVVDGGIMERIAIDNITMHKVNGSIFIRLGQREGDKPGKLRDVKINNVIADGIGLWRPEINPIYRKINKNPKIGITITGQPGFSVENVSLSNIYLQFAGGGTLEDAERIIDDNPHPYPEYNKFGVTPAYGFNCKHVKNIVFDNIRLDWIEQDDRPAMYFEDSKEITIGGLNSKVSSQAKAFIRIKDTDNVFVHSCKPEAVPIPFLSLERQIHDISIVGNDLRKVGKTYITDSSVDVGEIYEK